MKILIFAAATLLAAQTYSPPSGDQFARARTALNASLLDYPSARFRDVHGDQRRICGFVNSKNRMGAYTGWTRFLVMGLAGSPVVYETDDRAGMIQLLCVDENDPPLPTTDLSDRLTSR